MTDECKYVIKAVSALTKHQRIAYDSVFGSAARGHGDVKKLLAHPPDSLLSGVSIKSSYCRNIGLEMMAVKHVYTNTVVRRLAAIDASLPASTKSSMIFCAPPHAKIEHKCSLPHTTCRKPTICPSCRLRSQEAIFQRLVPYINDVSHIAVLQLNVCSGAVPSIDDNIELNDMLTKVYRRKWNTWERDAVIMLPRYLTEQRVWLPTSTIIALVKDKNKLWCPDDKLRVPTSWKLHPASADTLAQVIATTMAYPAQLMYNNSFTSDELIRLSHAYIGTPGHPAPYGLRFHGVSKPRRALAPALIVSDTNDKELINDSNQQYEYHECIPGWGFAHATTDVEQPAGHPGRRLELVRANHSVMPEWEQRPGIDG